MKGCKKMKDSFIFYRYLCDVAKDMDDSDRLKFYEDIIKYGLEEPIIETPPGEAVSARDGFLSLLLRMTYKR